MSSTDAEWSEAVTGIIVRLIAGTLSPEDAALEWAAATKDWTVSASSILELSQRVSRFLARLNGLIVMDGPPDPEVGELNTWYFDRLSGDFYGPKTAAGWGDSAFSLVGPAGDPGPTPDLSITVQTGAAGSSASVVKGGTAEAPTFEITIPRGDTGLTPALSAGETTTGAPGTSASVTMGPSSTPEAPVFDFTLPEGQRGAVGPAPNVTAEIVMIPHGQPAVVTRSGPDAAPVLTFQLPAPLDGEDGREVEFNVSATHIQIRYEGETEWADLIALAALQGPKGDRGDAFTIGATGDNLAARGAYDAEDEGFSFLDTSTGLIYFRQTSSAGVWSDGIPFGSAQSDILDALAALDAAEGILVQVGPSSFAKRPIGVAAGSSVPDRDAADLRYRRIGQAVPLEDVTGLVLALEGKADAAAVVAALANKADAQEVADALVGKADLVDGKVPSSQLPDPPAVPTFATVAEVRAGKTAGKIIDPKTALEAQANVAIARVDAATGIDFDTFINASINLDANGTLGPPSGGGPQKTGIITVINVSGSASLVIHSSYRQPKGGVTIEPGANSTTRIGYMFGGAGVVSIFPAVKWNA